MKNIKILEALALCLFSVVLFSFAVVQEKTQSTAIAAHASVQEVKPAEEHTSQATNLPSDRLSFNFIPSVSFAKVITWVISFIIGISLLILIVGFLFYNIYSIRP